MAYIGKSIESGTFSVLDTSGNTYNGSNTAFNLGTQVGSVAQLLVSHDGVIQKPGTDYTLSSGGAAITFTTAPASGASIFIVEISGAVGGPLDSDLNGTELILDADGDTSITADTDDQIDIKVGGTDVVTLTNSNLLLKGTTPTITIGDAGAEDTKIQFDGNAQDFYIGLDDSGDEFQIGRGSTLGAGREFSIGASGPVFNEDSDTHDFRVETDDQTHAFFIHGANDKASFNEATPDADAGGITLNQGANDGNCFTLKNSDVAHGVTNTAETDTYFKIQKNNSSLGGAEMTSFSEDIKALELGAMVGAVHTTKSTSGELAINARGRLKSGTAGANMSSNANIFGVSSNNTTVMIVDTEGEIHSDGGAQSAYDTYDDAQLVRAYDLSHGRGVIDSKFDKFISYNHEKLAEMKLVGREEDGTPNHFVNVTGMQRLHNGAIWQQYEKHNQLLEAVYELAEKAIGKKEANAILDKHEVKRLN